VRFQDRDGPFVARLESSDMSLDIDPLSGRDVDKCGSTFSRSQFVPK
jgi:hypothetical protein